MFFAAFSHSPSRRLYCFMQWKMLIVGIGHFIFFEMTHEPKLDLNDSSLENNQSKVIFRRSFLRGL